MTLKTYLPVRKLTNVNVDLSLLNPVVADTATSVVNTVPGESQEAVSSYLAAALADNTRRAYQGDLADFLLWGGTLPCRPEVFVTYITDRAETLSPHTITRRVVGIGRAHVSQGLPDPAKNDLVRTVLRGVRRKNGTAQRQVTPLLKQDLLALMPYMQGTKGIRDRALVLLGFAAALRRSELVALDAQDLQFVKEGVLVNLRRSKTDQEGEGRRIAVPYGRTSACPVKAVQHWLEHAQIIAGAIFRSVSKSGHVAEGRLTAQSVALILKTYAQTAGLKASDISGHSLRSGLVTSAAQAGVAAHKIQQQTGHRSTEMLVRYIRDANLFENNAAGLLL
jgi:site-specific recombinase XerD